MPNGKSGQKARINSSKVIIGLIVLLLSIGFGIDLKGIISVLSSEKTKSNETQPEQTYLETTQSSSSVEGQLVVHMIDVGTIIIPDSRNGKITANWYLNLMKEFQTGNYKIQYAEQGDIYELGDANMQVLAAETDVSNTNNYSIVLKVSFGEMDMIMTGDAETEIERKILESGVDIDAEILKVGHHGSDTSNSEAFLDAISPDYGLISCGYSNKYDHPIKEVMERLKERNVEIYRTDELGSVVMTITSDSVTFSCEPGDYLSGIELEERTGK